MCWWRFSMKGLPNGYSPVFRASSRGEGGLPILMAVMSEYPSPWLSPLPPSADTCPSWRCDSPITVRVLCCGINCNPLSAFCSFPHRGVSNLFSAWLIPRHDHTGVQRESVYATLCALRWGLIIAFLCEQDACWAAEWLRRPPLIPAVTG